MEDHSLGRVVSVLISPVKTFQSIAERPTWLVALLVLIAASVVSMLVAMPKIDWQESIREEVERSGREVPAAQLETQVDVMEKFGSTMIWVTVAVSPWIIYPLMAAIFLGLFRVLGSELSFKASLAVTVHGFMPWLVATLLGIPVMLGAGDITTTQLKDGVLMSHLGVLAGEDAGAALIAFLSSLDFFSVWAMILFAIGYSTCAKVSQTKAAVCVVGVWAVYVAGKVGLTALGAMAGG